MDELDAVVERFRTRPLAGTYPYVWLDATYLKVRQDGRVISMAVVIAVACLYAILKVSLGRILV